LRTLEEFLLDYPGCILIVSHDRYFMDRMVDHLFAFEGNGVIRDFPGNYTQYREAVTKGLLTNNAQIMVSREDVVEKKPAHPISQAQDGGQKKLSYKEKTELENIDKQMPLLLKEKQQLEEKMGGNIPYEELQKAADRVSHILKEIDAKEMRWLELSERV
jgi:ATP-binding cassette subfamily F protein uup